MKDHKEIPVVLVNWTNFITTFIVDACQLDLIFTHKKFITLNIYIIHIKFYVKYNISIQGDIIKEKCDLVQVKNNTSIKLECRN